MSHSTQTLKAFCTYLRLKRTSILFVAENGGGEKIKVGISLCNQKKDNVPGRRDFTSFRTVQSNVSNLSLNKKWFSIPSGEPGAV